MALVQVNGDPTPLPYPQQTWGELLKILDAERAEQQEVVTAVRLDGVDTPAFRTNHAMVWPLGETSSVTIETARPLDLLRQTIDEAEQATTAILAGTRQLGRAFRSPELIGANRGLAELASSLGALIVVTRTVAQAAEVNLGMVGDGQVSASKLIEQLISLTETLLVTQRARHWGRLADLIEGPLADAVGRWPHVLNAIRASSPVLVTSVA